MINCDKCGTKIYEKDGSHLNIEDFYGWVCVFCYNEFVEDWEDE